MWNGVDALALMDCDSAVMATNETHNEWAARAVWRMLERIVLEIARAK